MADTITLTQKQLQTLLARFKDEIGSGGGDLTDDQIEEVAQRLLADLRGTCDVSGTKRMLNTNVNIKLG